MPLGKRLDLPRLVFSSPFLLVVPLVACSVEGHPVLLLLQAVTVLRAMQPQSSARRQKRREGVRKTGVFSVILQAIKLKTCVKVRKLPVFLAICSIFPPLFAGAFYFCRVFDHITKTHQMNKGDLINKIAADANVTKAQATDALHAVIDGITATLKAGDKVTLVGFGTFSISKREARSGRNPQTGKTITIAAKNVVRFKPGKELADSMN